MSLRDRIKQEQQTIGSFKAHPTGDFDAVITEVKQKEINGAWLFEVHLKTNVGTTKTSIWYQTAQDINGKLMELTNGDRTKAEDIYVKGIARLCYTYKILGLGEIDGTDQQIEQQVYSRLGEWAGRSCRVAVRENKKDENNPYVYINEPKGAQHTGGAGSSWPPQQSQAAQQAAAINYGNAPQQATASSPTQYSGPPAGAPNIGPQSHPQPPQPQQGSGPIPAGDIPF